MSGSNNTQEHGAETVPGLLKELRDETTRLIRQEAALAKSEVHEKVSVVSSNLAQLAGGALVAYAGAVILFLAVSVGLYAVLTRLGMAEMTAGWLAPLVVGGVLTTAGVIMTKKAIETIKTVSPVPEKTVDTIQTNAKWAKEKVTS